MGKAETKNNGIRKRQRKKRTGKSRAVSSPKDFKVVGEPTPLFPDPLRASFSLKYHHKVTVNETKADNCIYHVYKAI